MTTASTTYNPALGSVDQIIAANEHIVASNAALREDHPHPVHAHLISGGYKTTLAYMSAFGDQMMRIQGEIPSFALDLYDPSNLRHDNYIEAKNTVDALHAVAEVREPAKVILFLAQNIEVGNLSLELATATSNRRDVGSVVVEIEEDPESFDRNLFVTAVVATEDFDIWDAIEEDTLTSILGPNAAKNRARVVFSIAHAESV